jgi:hypothetical protein
MKNKRHTEIKLETHEVTIIRTRQRRTAFCEFCQANVWMLPPDTAAVLVQSTARSIFRRVEAGELHFIETREGALLVCCKSLETSQKGLKPEPRNY